MGSLSMLTEPKAIEVNIYTHEDRVSAILDYLFQQKIAGAIALRAYAGFGTHHHMHTTRLVELAPDPPAIVRFLDKPSKVAAALPHVAKLAHGGLITTREVDIYLAPENLPL
jgi:PII-like signaling protein